MAFGGKLDDKFTEKLCVKLCKSRFIIAATLRKCELRSVKLNLLAPELFF